MADRSARTPGSGEGPDHFGRAWIAHVGARSVPRAANDNPVPTGRRLRRAAWWFGVALLLIAAVVGSFHG